MHEFGKVKYILLDKKFEMKIPEIYILEASQCISSSEIISTKYFFWRAS